MKLLPGLLVALLLIGSATVVVAEEQPAVTEPITNAPTAAEPELSKEDQQVVAMLELLQMMELLKDLDEVTALEETR